MNIKSFAASSGILVLSNVLLKAINFFLMPIYTRHLTTEMLGISDTITTFTGLLFPICMLGLDSAFSTFYYDQKKKQAEKVFHTVLFILLVIGMVPLFLCGLSSQISYLLFKTETYSMIIILSLISVSFNIWYMPFALNLRMENKMLVYSLINVISSVGLVILNIIFVVFLDLKALSLILSTAIVHICQFALFFFVNKMKIDKTYFEWYLLKNMLKFSLPLVPGVILTWILSLSDRYMLLYFQNVKEVGLYGVGTRLVTVLNIFISSVNMAYTTFAFGSKNDKNAKEKYIKIFDLLIFCLSIVCYTGALFSREIISIMAAPDYQSAYVIVRDLMFAQLFYGITSIVAYGIFFEKKSQYSLYANAVGAVINILLNFFLIPKFGISAAAFTTLIGYIVTFLFTYYFSQKVYFCGYKIKKALLWIGLLYAVSYTFYNINFFYRCILWGIAVMIAFVSYKEIAVEFLGVFIVGKNRRK